MNNRFVSARKHATNIVKSLGLIPPVEPTSIIKNLGFDIIEEENQLGIEAFSKLNNHPTIIINPEFDFPARKKFTLAHELGHIIIPWHNGDIKCNTDRPYAIINGTRFLDTQELEANIFASELLMPQQWLEKQIYEILDDNPNNFENLIKTISKKAGTSIMACMYALENSLPPGHLYYVKIDGTNYWKKFSSQRTDLSFQFNCLDDKYGFTDYICESKDEFHISRYEVKHFYFCPCPDKDTISNLYSHFDNSIINLINTITDYQPLKIFSSLDYLLSALPNPYFISVFIENEKIKVFKNELSKCKCYINNFEDYIYILTENNIPYETIKIDNIKLLFISEEDFELPNVKSIEPNTLLKNIVSELYPDNKGMLQSINGVVSAINSFNKTATETELYNLIKYRFALEYKYIDFYKHKNFDTYVVNKIRTMIERRKFRNILNCNY